MKVGIETIGTNKNIQILESILSDQKTPNLNENDNHIAKIVRKDLQRSL